MSTPLSWFGIVRLGLVQAALGSIVVLVISTLNRVMVVEYALPATIPGALVALHYAVQMIRPRFGYGSDLSTHRAAWILIGMGALAIGEIACAVAAVSLSAHRGPALVLASAGYALVGLGVGAAGTSLLVLLARRVDDRKRAAAATLTWVFMIAGFAVTSALVGQFLDPFSPRRLLMVTTTSAAIACFIAAAALWRIDAPGARAVPAIPVSGRRPFAQALGEVWSNPRSRRFTLFVFVSMLAYSAQELLLEPFAGLIFGYSIGASARLSGLWHGAAFAGMVAVGILCAGERSRWLRACTVGGCCACAGALLALAWVALMGPSSRLPSIIVALGIANGVFAVSAIGSMMQLAHRGAAGSAGVRLGLWGGAQAVAFALGGLIATTLVDSSRHLFGSPAAAFAAVFFGQSCLFFWAAWFARQAAAAGQRQRSRILEAAA